MIGILLLYEKKRDKMHSRDFFSLRSILKIHSHAVEDILVIHSHCDIKHQQNH